MADTGAIKAGKAYIEITGDMSPLAAALARALSRHDGLQIRVLSNRGRRNRGLRGNRRGVAFATASHVTHLLHEAEQVGASFGFISSLSTAMQIAGGSADGATRRIFHFQSVLAQALNGSGSRAASVRAPGHRSGKLERPDTRSADGQTLGSFPEHGEPCRRKLFRGCRSSVAALIWSSRCRGPAAWLQCIEEIKAARARVRRAGREKEVSEQVVGASDSERFVDAHHRPGAVRSDSHRHGQCSWGRGAAVRDWGKEHLQTLMAVGNALGAGQFQLAWDVGLAGMKVAWLEFKQYLMNSFPTLGAAFNFIWEEGGFMLRPGCGTPSRASSFSSAASKRQQLAADRRPRSR